LGKLIRWYADGLDNMAQVKGIAKQIHDRWSRMLYDINTKYDPEGDHEEKYVKIK
jgi:hypothetical protein